MEAVNGLKDFCDAVDIASSNSSNSNTCLNDDHDKWNSWLHCIQRVHEECRTPIVCKLPFSQKTVDDTIRKEKSLQEAGCEVIHKLKYTQTTSSLVS